MENTTLASVNAALPTLMKNFSYDAIDGMFHTLPYVTDRASYYQGARISDKIAIVYNLADGFYHRFLNGVKIYGGDGKGGTKLLTEATLPMYEGVIWSERIGQMAAQYLLADYIQNQCTIIGIPRPSQNQALQVAGRMVRETRGLTQRMGLQMSGRPLMAISR